MHHFLLSYLHTLNNDDVITLRPWKDYWSSTACDKTRRTSRGVGAVAVVPKHPVEVDFLHLSEHASDIKFDSALYVDAAEYLWHPLEKHEFKAPSEASMIPSGVNSFRIVLRPLPLSNGIVDVSVSLSAVNLC